MENFMKIKNLLTGTLLFVSLNAFAGPGQIGSSSIEMDALLVQNLNQTQVNKEATPSGPIASISSLATMGFSVSNISFSKKFANEQSDNFCSVSVKMNRGDESKGYIFTLITEKGFSQSMAAKEGKKYSDLSESYRNAVSHCLAMTK
jgi:hypothetical protein